MMSRLRASVSGAAASRASRSSRQLRMFACHDAADGVHEIGPAASLFGQHFPPLGRDPVEAPLPLRLAVAPLPRDPAALLEPVEQRIERGRLELAAAVRSRVDQLADLVAMPRPLVHEGQDEELRAAFLELAIARRGAYML